MDYIKLEYRGNNTSGITPLNRPVQNYTAEEFILLMTENSNGSQIIQDGVQWEDHQKKHNIVSHNEHQEVVDTETYFQEKMNEYITNPSNYPITNGTRFRIQDKKTGAHYWTIEDYSADTQMFSMNNGAGDKVSVYFQTLLDNLESYKGSITHMGNEPLTPNNFLEECKKHTKNAKIFENLEQEDDRFIKK